MSESRYKVDDRDDDDDLPDDFFDEFSNSDFLNGLNVVDAWEKPRVLEDDIRDLLRSRKEEAARTSRDTDPVKEDSRRDPAKTNRDIKKDKEAKLKEHLAKRVQSPAGPPGTELDDFEFDRRRKDKTSESLKNHSPVGRRRSRGRRSPVRRRSRSSHRRRSPSPQRRRSPSPARRRSPRRRSPKISPSHRSPRRSNRSPIRPRRSPLQFRRSPPPQRRRSPSPHRERHRRRSRSRSRKRSSSRTNFSLSVEHPSAPSSFIPGVPNAAYSNQYCQPAYQAFPSSDPYYQPGMACAAPSPYYPGQSFSYQQAEPPAPYYPPAGMPPLMISNTPLPVPAPVMPPAPLQSNQDPSALHHIGVPIKQAADSLDQLLESGKISKEDYLKLRPKSHPTDKMDMKEKVKVLTRCHEAVTKLAKLHLPNRLIMSNMYKIPEQKAIVSKFCSPLKRQPLVNFNFTSAKNSTYQANKQLVDSIVATVGLQEVIKSVQKKLSNSKDAACQTTTPFCEECEIRKLTKSNEKTTSIDADHFSSSVHTQVIEAELASSKTTFTPVGNMSDSGGAVSMSHLTPAQLIVSQLAARAKKLENPPSNDGDMDRYSRRPGNPHSSYYGSQMYQNHRY